MLVVAGHETRVFLVHSSNIMNECHLEELPSPVVLRSHAAYVIVTNKITIWFGKDSATRERECARFVAQRLSYTVEPYFTSADEDLDVVEVEEPENPCNLPIIRAKDWQQVCSL